MVSLKATTWDWPLEESKGFFEKKSCHPCFLLHCHASSWLAQPNVINAYYMVTLQNVE
jgi:hypothetical protein